MLSLAPVTIGKGFRKEETAMGVARRRSSFALTKFHSVASYPAMIWMNDFDDDRMNERPPQLTEFNMERRVSFVNDGFGIPS